MKDQINHPNSKRITIYRTGTFISRAQGALADEYFSQSKDGVGSYFESVNSQKIGSGLTFKEEELLLPNIIDTPPEDREFRKKVSNFYIEIYTDVPFNGGVTLEVGLESDNEKPISKDNMPLKLMDYLRYRHAMAHPKVAANKDAAEGNQMISFYIFDKDAVQNKNSKKIKQRDAAMQEYLKVKNDSEQVDQMLTLLGVDPREFIGRKDEDDLKVEALRELAEKKAEDFMAAYEAGDLEIRASIQAMVNCGVLRKVGNRYIDVESQEVVANELDELILIFKDDLMSGIVAVLKARMQEAMKKPVAPKGRKTIVS